MNEPVTIGMLLIFIYGCAAVAIISYYVGKWYYKNVCENCKHNDKEIADEMFFVNYCTLWGCSMGTNKHLCKYKERKPKKESEEKV